MKIIFLLISFLLHDGYCTAQQDSLPNHKLERTTPEWMVKFNLLSIFDTDGGLNFSGEYILPDLWLGFQLEAQPVLFDVYRNNLSNAGFEAPVGVIRSGAPFGVKLRPEIRYYIGGMNLRMPRFSRGNERYMITGESRRRLQNRTYLAVDFLYKNVERQRLSEFEINSGGSQPSYKQQATYTDRKQVMGWDFKVGFTTVTKGEHWLADLYFGFGVRYKKFSYRGIPAGAMKPERYTLGFPGPNRSTAPAESYPSIPVGLKIVYRF